MNGHRLLTIRVGKALERHSWRSAAISVPRYRYNSVRKYSVGQYRTGLLQVNRSHPAVALASIRELSTSKNVEKDLSFDQSLSHQEQFAIPDPPPAPSNDTADAAARILQDNIHELGLGSYFTPAGWIQNLLNVLHISTGLPWWEVIALSTVFIRTCTVPIIIWSQRVAAHAQESQPEIERIQRKVEEARNSGDQLQLQIASMEMQQYFMEKHLPMMKKMLAPILANGAVFATYFFALRGMASAPLWSMKSEGALWFTDLTVPDPLTILPTMCALSAFLVIEIGIEFGVGANTMQPGVRWLLRLMPLGIIVFANNFPAAIVVYWLTSNIFSLILSLVLRISSVRRLVKLPALPPAQKAPLRESWRVPQFVRDYLSGPVLFMRAAQAKFRKGDSKSTSSSTRSEKDEKAHDQK